MHKRCFLLYVSINTGLSWFYQWYECQNRSKILNLIWNEIVYKQLKLKILNIFFYAFLCVNSPAQFKGRLFQTSPNKQGHCSCIMCHQFMGMCQISRLFILLGLTVHILRFIKAGRFGIGILLQPSGPVKTSNASWNKRWQPVYVTNVGPSAARMDTDGWFDWFDLTVKATSQKL